MRSNEKTFSTDHLKDDLKGRSIRGGIATFLGQGIKFLLNLCSVVVLARLLTPQDYGLVAMATAITGFIMLFKDMGLSMATVQKDEVTQDQVSTLFWINLAFSLVLMVLTLALAPVIAFFYGDPQLVGITETLSVAFLLGGLTVQHQALLRRQMRFSVLALIDILAMAAGVLCAILLALAGYGYWALVGLPLATAATTALGVWLAIGWIPGFPVRGSGVRDMLKFGGYLSGFGLVNYFARNADQILIGRFFGAQQLGFYNRAYSLLLLPIGQITAPMTAVAVPVLSRLQKEPARYRNYYLNAIKLVAYLTFPLIAVLFVLSEEVVQIVLGDQWIQASSIFRILAISAFIQPVVSTVGWIYISLGQANRMMLWGLFSTSVYIFAFIIGTIIGFYGIVWSYVIATILLMHPQLFFATKISPMKTKDLYNVLMPPFILSMYIGIGCLVVKLLYNPHSVIGVIGIYFVAVCALFGLSLVTIAPIRRDIIGYIDNFGALKKTA